MNKLFLVTALLFFYTATAQQEAIVLSNDQISFICAKHIMSVKNCPVDGDIALITPHYTGFLRKFGTEIYQVIQTNIDKRFIAQEVSLKYKTDEIKDLVTRWDTNVSEIDKKYFHDMSELLRTAPDTDALYTTYTLHSK